MTSLPEHSTSIVDRLRLLQTRIREGTGPDRELDCDIDRVLRGRSVWPEHGATYSVEGHVWVSTDYYTTDPDGLGACVALMREVLPGCEWTRNQFGCFLIWSTSGNAVPSIMPAPKLANDCLTFLDAIIAAKISEEESSTLTASSNEKRE